MSYREIGAAWDPARTRLSPGSSVAYRQDHRAPDLAADSHPVLINRKTSSMNFVQLVQGRLAGRGYTQVGKNSGHRHLLRIERGVL